MSKRPKKFVDPSWPRRPPGGTWGDPSSSKFAYGPSSFNPCDCDLNWREQINKENKRYYKLKQQLAERLMRGDNPEPVEIETAKRLFGDSNLLTKLAQRDPQTSMKVSAHALEKALKQELSALGGGAKDAAQRLVVAQKARVEAELRAAVAQANKQSAVRELQNLKRSVGGLKMITARSDASTLSAMSGMSGSVFSSAGRSVASPKATGRSRMRRSVSGPALTGRSAVSARSGGSRPLTGRSGMTYGSGSYATMTARTGGSSMSRISSGSVLKTPKSWRGKTLNELLAQKREARKTARAARTSGRLPAYMEE